MRNIFSVVIFIFLLIACSNNQNTDSRSIETTSPVSSPQTYNATNIPEFFTQVLQQHKTEIKHI